ncbi:putative pectin lyase [Hortaea werneckii]|uniref:pectin lyase n=1 Tax=Hortaea werneckii TaxID=91943 RepID=A0A3M7FQT2_HORWE|nr:putative pectin lyase [Hortaea werneckii]KAI6889357.1 putative pectin lyase [Hortaea werneckii]KAI7001049.1 putative pectin lyase [Hortaea werneckii]KAI7145463.1 putative pectin lyase [Hortaea werneckii]KAI7174228.1 putative pectin lyase [Hortaea werneckii]
MKTSLLSFLVAQAASIAAVSVSGAAEGFAKGVTGGGNAAAVYPSTTDELVSYLEDDQQRVVVLQKTFDFRGTEGTTSATGCAPWGTGSGCQTAINQNGWCDNYQPDAPHVSVSYDNAATLGITVKSHKTIIGEGNSGAIVGKGLRIVSGASNIIIQNIAITDLNPQYVWGGDAITLNGADLVWIDHVTTARIGRQHIVLGNSADNRVTISNCYINGYSQWSAKCNNHHYWAIYLTGSSDLVTMKNNYIYYTSGRGPKVGGNTLLHAVNNYWYQVEGHAFEVGSGAQIVAEGNIFQNVDNPIQPGAIEGRIFTSPSTGANQVCNSYLGHNCVLNAFGSSGDFTGTSDTSFLVNFNGKNIASAESTSGLASSIQANAGQGNL